MGPRQIRSPANEGVRAGQEDFWPGRLKRGPPSGSGDTGGPVGSRPGQVACRSQGAAGEPLPSSSHGKL